jgi:hypothetical protein
VAHKTGAIGAKDLERVVVDTTVQPKAVAHPTDAPRMVDAKRQSRSTLVLNHHPEKGRWSRVPSGC